ncbi:MAG: ATP-binding cassette domain-containing protein, partial [Pseudomonadota bacterium]
EKGIMLSGGQRQRLAIARAMLISAPILILDDPLSEVDSDTASLILDSLKQAARSRTTIIVSHRLHHVSFADTIIVMEEGRVIEKGSHEQLVRLGEGYKKMYELQLMMDS